MSALSSTDFFVGREFILSSHISTFDYDHSLQSLKYCLKTPKTSSTKISHLVGIYRTTISHRLIFFDKFHRKRIHTVSRIEHRHPFTTKYMSEMGTTVVTCDLSTTTICIESFSYIVTDRIIKCWPSATRVKFAL
jgi:hypothetical protein